MAMPLGLMGILWAILRPGDRRLWALVQRGAVTLGGLALPWALYQIVVGNGKISLVAPTIELKGGGSEVTLLIRFGDHASDEVPYMYHCHLLRHEDNGMMQVISMSPDAGRCEAGTPSNIARLKMWI